MLDFPRPHTERAVNLIREIQRVPHLKLDIQFDLSQLLEELGKVRNWYPHYPCDWQDWPEHLLKEYTLGYSGCSLYEYNGRSDYLRDDYFVFGGKNHPPGVEFHPTYKTMIFKPTPQLAELPYMRSCISRLVDNFGRTRIMRSEPDHRIVWHSHNNGPWNHPLSLEAIVHIPIITNPRVLHVVGDYRDPRVRALKAQNSTYEEIVGNPKFYVANYPAGECWLFNGWHDHYYHNYGSETRYTLLMYVSWLGNDRFLDLLERSLSLYSGPKLPY